MGVCDTRRIAEYQKYGVADAKAAFILKCNNRLALSGTPMENNIMELYSLFRFLNPGMLGDAGDFSRQYAIPIQNEADTEAMTSLRRKTVSFYATPT